MFSSIVSTSRHNLSYFNFRNSKKLHLDPLVFVRLRQIVQETEKHQMYDASTRTIIFYITWGVKQLLKYC